jgi:ribosomal protein S18 acetylase RimI-like enzyme
VTDVLRSVEIGQATVDEAEELSALAIKTYVHTFGAEFEPDELAHHLERTISVARWREYLTRDRTLIARIAGRAIGYVQLGHARQAGEIEIRRLYVDADFQERGIGSELLRRALSAPETAAASAVLIDVWEKNHRARQLYERFGFRHEGGTEPFYLKSGEIDGYDMVLVRRRSEP